MASNSAILNAEHLKQIHNAQDLIKAAERELDLAKRVGIPTADLEKRIADAKTFFTQVSQVYFNGA